MSRPSERTEALALANRVLDRQSADPDDDLAMLARQLLRGQEVINKLKDDLQAAYDPMADLIHANRDEILKKHEEAAKRIHRVLVRPGKPEKQLDTIQAILEALNLFHPMHGESWVGWPEES